MTDKTTFRSEINGIKFDSVNGTTNHLLTNPNKTAFVKPEKPIKMAKNGKAKVSVGADDNEQEIG